mmetsp:Transcript_33403/g.114926  ORF Transcript_33403/g.114926 Transcript_33403/m.114926 type:complete len:257 (-) Transcript_33403:449-1219(-)
MRRGGRCGRRRRCRRPTQRGSWATSSPRRRATRWRGRASRCGASRHTAATPTSTAGRTPTNFSMSGGGSRSVGTSASSSAAATPRPSSAAKTPTTAPTTRRPRSRRGRATFRRATAKKRRATCRSLPCARRPRGSSARVAASALRRSARRCTATTAACAAAPSAATTAPGSASYPRSPRTWAPALCASATAATRRWTRWRARSVARGASCACSRCWRLSLPRSNSGRSSTCRMTRPCTRRAGACAASWPWRGRARC